MKVAILGAAGPIGSTVAHTLSARGVPVRLVGRQQSRLEALQLRGAEVVAADVATRQGCEAALRGATAAVYALGLPYTKQAWTQYPPMMRTCLDVAKDQGVEQFVLITNVYPYGLPRTHKVREDHPRIPVSVKGEWRKQQEDLVLSARGLRTLSLRLPNFYGPDSRLSLADPVFAAAVRGEVANLLGPIDTRQELVFTPDVGPVVADLLGRPDAFGEAYNLGGAAETTWRAFAQEVFRSSNHPFRFRVAGKTMLRVAGLFSEVMRELVEMSYLQSDPVLLDDTKLQRVLPHVRKTPYAEGILRTLEGYARAAPGVAAA